ncbi:hypothetical protein ACFOJ6_09170 [Gordonia humi]|uniref:hypothetical protein n=1 Tax=Gordonia humi TaxID=686429 RepID=UPI00360BFF5F
MSSPPCGSNAALNVRTAPRPAESIRLHTCGGSVRDRVFHTWTAPSIPACAISGDVGSTATDHEPPVTPGNAALSTRGAAGSVTFHNCTLGPSPPTASVWPSGRKANACVMFPKPPIGSPIGAAVSPVIRQSRTVWSSPPDASSDPFGSNARVRTALR